MLVRNWMTRDVITIDADAGMADAIELLENHRINMLPVMSGRRLVGVVSDRGLKRASASDATGLDIFELRSLLAKIKVKQVMPRRKPITVSLDDTIEETAEVLLGNRISGAPVVDAAGRLQGIITGRDILKIYMVDFKENKREILREDLLAWKDN